MATRKLHITEFDKTRLEELIAVADEFGGRRRNDLQALVKELEIAEIAAPTDVPPDVVTMNSKVVLRDLDSSEEMTYVLVFPGDANIEESAI